MRQNSQFFIFCIVIFTTLTVTGCSGIPKENGTAWGAPRQESLPGEQNGGFIDLDGDNFVDIEIVYGGMATMDIPTSARNLAVSLKPLRENRLYKNQDGRSGPLPEGQLIGSFDEWSEWGVGLAVIGWKRSLGWEMKWTGTWIDPPSPYLGVMVERGGRKHYGWIAVACDDLTGTVEVLDFYVNDEPGVSVVVGRPRFIER